MGKLRAEQVDLVNFSKYFVVPKQLTKDVVFVYKNNFNNIIECLFPYRGVLNNLYVTLNNSEPFENDLVLNIEERQADNSWLVIDSITLGAGQKTAAKSVNTERIIDGKIIRVVPADSSIVNFSNLVAIVSFKNIGPATQL